MSKKYYHKSKQAFLKKGHLFKALSLTIVILGFAILTYVFLPFLSWQIYFAPIFAGQNIASPIPKINIVSSNTFQSLLSQASNNLTGVDYGNAQNWYPGFNPNYKNGNGKIQTYFISIPKINIKDAVVSTVDNDLTIHLVNYHGTAIPPSKGNAVIFGHSTLPQLFNPKDYKTIFANAYRLETGDEIVIKITGIIYTYKISNIIVTEPKDTSIFEQNYSDSFLTLVTCTPPGTTWKRLIIKATLQNL